MPDGTGSITSHDGFTSSGAWVNEVNEVRTSLSTDRRTLTVTITATRWEADNGGGQFVPIPNPKYPPFLRVGDRSVLRFVHTQLMRSDPLPPASHGIGNPYICGNVLPEDQRYCGA